MPYRLKQNVEAFEIMSGPDEGKKFGRGKTYDSVPDGFADRFDPVSEPNPFPARKPSPAETRNRRERSVETAPPSMETPEKENE